MKKLTSLFVKIIFIFIVAIILTIVGGQKVQAAHPSSVGTIYEGEKVGSNIWFHVKYTDDYKVFCTSGLLSPTPVGNTCTLITGSEQWNEPTQAAIGSIISEYKNGNINGTENPYWYAEVAVNTYLGNYMMYAGNNDKIVQNLISQAKDAYKKADAKFSLNLSSSKLTFAKNGNYYVSNVITVKDAGGYLDNYTVSVSGTKGVEVFNKKGNTFQVRFPISNVGVGQTVSVSATVKGTKSYNIGKKYFCGNSVQNVTIDYVEPVTKKDSKTIKGSVERKGNSVEIIKVDAVTKQPIAGAKLVLKDLKGNVIESWYTTTQPKKFNNLQAGIYKLSEETPKAGYKKSTEVKTIVVKEDNKTIKETFENYPATGVKVLKLDADTDKLLAGATLVIKDVKGNVVKTLTSGDKAIKVDLDPGSYTLEETKAPEGYKMSGEKKVFIVDKKGGYVAVEVRNYPETGVKVLKIDAATEKPLAGATLVIKDAKGNVVKTINSGEEAIKVDLEPGNYTLEETKAPSGYKKSGEKKAFTVDKKGGYVEVEYRNYPETGVKVLKIDAATEKPLAGATLVIKDAKGNVVKTINSGEEAIKVDLEPGNYTLEETKAPSGYKKSGEVKPFTVDEKGGYVEVEYRNYRETGASISKQDVTTKEELPGATLVIKDVNGNEIANWVSTDKPHYVELEPGKYTLTETISPVGYKLSTETIEFVVKSDGTVTPVIMYNEPIGSVEISKKDITTEEELPGATLVVKDASGKEVLKWVSVTKPKKFELSPGKYTLTEISAPKGYKLSTETVEFEVKNDGTVTPVVMYNSPKTGAKISKQDITNKGVELPGATLVIKDENGNEVESWVSTDKPYYVELDPGKYTLTEILQPKGYKLSTETVEFEVKNDGTVTPVVMYNSPKTGARISKQDITSKEELPGATLVVKDANGNEIESWVSTSTPHYVELEPGSYTLTETIAPVGYKLSSETIAFEVNEDGVPTEVVMYNETSRVGVKISKQDITSKEELPGATLVVKDTDGNEIARWVSTNEPRYIELEPGDYTLTEISAPNGYDLSYEVVTFTVDSEGNATTDVVMYNSKTPVTADQNMLFTLIGFVCAGVVGAVAITKLRHQM